MALKKQYCNSVQFYFLFLLLMSLLIVLAAFCLWGMLGTPQNKVKRILLMALDFSFLFFSISIIYLLIYNLSSRFQLMHIVSYNPRIFSIVLSADGLSLLLLTLTTLLIPICVLSSWKSIKHLVKEFIICLLLLEVALFLVFTVFDLLLFYIFFWKHFNTYVINNRDLRVQRGKGHSFVLFFFLYFSRVFIYVIKSI